MMQNNNMGLLKKVAIAIIGLFILSLVFTVAFFVFIAFVSVVVTAVIVRYVVRKVGSNPKSKKEDNYSGKTIDDVDYSVVNDDKNK